MFTMNLVYRIVSRPLAKYSHFNYINELKFLTARAFETSQHVLSEKKFNLDPTKIVKRDGTVIKKRTEEQKLITLVSNSSEKVLTLNDALKLANHKGLHLVKIKKPSPKAMDFYKLSNVPDSDSNQLKKKQAKMKTYVFKANIAEHDLLNKAKGLIGALNKYKIASYAIENLIKDQKVTDELSDRVQKAITNAGINFKITGVKGNLLNRTFIVEKKDKDVSVEDVKDSQSNEANGTLQENNNKS